MSVLDFGAVANRSDVASAVANSKALEAALAAANPGGTALVPASADGPFYVSATSASGLAGVTLRLEGQLVASANITAWPNNSALDAADVLHFENCTALTLEGGGGVDGQGYGWWEAFIFGRLGSRHRPRALHVVRADGFTLRNLVLSNSAQQHLRLDDSRLFLAENVTVYADTSGQRRLMERAGWWDQERGLPMYPINTDGMDLQGRDMVVRNCSFSVYDDNVVPKPQHAGGGLYSNCTRNITVTGVRTHLGVGMSIGSVPPHPGVNCVRDVLFDGVTMTRPYKSVYVKTNPAPPGVPDPGTGLIQNITFRNFAVESPLWITGPYIGPQQMLSHSHNIFGLCILYPLAPCPTDPLVTIRDVLLQNISVTGGRGLFPGIVRCNATNPCQNIVFDNVVVDEGRPYICENANVTSLGGTSPAPSCGVA